MAKERKLVRIWIEVDRSSEDSSAVWMPAKLIEKTLTTKELVAIGYSFLERAARKRNMSVADLVHKIEVNPRE